MLLRPGEGSSGGLVVRLREETVVPTRQPRDTETPGRGGTEQRRAGETDQRTAPRRTHQGAGGTEDLPDSHPGSHDVT